MQATVSIPFTTTAPGPFTLAHNLDMIPTTVVIEYTSTGIVWFQNPRYDETNLYLEASDADVSGIAIVFASCGNC